MVARLILSRCARMVVPRPKLALMSPVKAGAIVRQHGLEVEVVDYEQLKAAQGWGRSLRRRLIRWGDWGLRGLSRLLLSG
jgi:hypothetical protein